MNKFHREVVFIEKSGDKEVIISMIDMNIRNEVKLQLSDDGIPIILMSDLLEEENDVVVKNREFVANYHISIIVDGENISLIEE